MITRGVLSRKTEQRGGFHATEARAPHGVPRLLECGNVVSAASVARAIRLRLPSFKKCWDMGSKMRPVTPHFQDWARECGKAVTLEATQIGPSGRC
jgi:hypothetical protein